MKKNKKILIRLAAGVLLLLIVTVRSNGDSGCNTVEAANVELSKIGESGAQEPVIAELPGPEAVLDGAATATKWGIPQEYYGDPEGRGPGRIIVKGFDYNNIEIGRHTVAWEGDYWTASNGVELKVIPVDGTSTGCIPIGEGRGKDLEPTSPFHMAYLECQGEDPNKYAADLNVTIPLAAYKRTEIAMNDADLLAYRDAYDYKLWSNAGMPELYTPYEHGVTPFINLRFAVASNGIGEFGISGEKPWDIFRYDDHWEIAIYELLEAYQWDGIHQVLRYLSPDGDLLYAVIYQDFYYGDLIPEYDVWYAYGNSQVMAADGDPWEVIYYDFK